MIERDADHRYWLVDAQGRREALGVTRSLVEANLVDDEYFTERARGRGKLVHEFAERILSNTLNRPIDAAALGPLTGLRKFLDKYGPKVNGTEVVLAHEDRLLAGTCDLDLEMLGGKAVVELKLSTPTAWHALQLAPYAFLLDRTSWLSRGRFGLYLNDRGGYRLKEFDAASDLDYFFRAFELLHWRCRYGSYERPYGRKPVDAISERGSEWDAVRDAVSGRDDGSDFIELADPFL